MEPDTGDDIPKPSASNNITTATFQLSEERIDNPMSDRVARTDESNETDWGDPKTHPAGLRIDHRLTETNALLEQCHAQFESANDLLQRREMEVRTRWSKTIDNAFEQSATARKIEPELLRRVKDEVKQSFLKQMEDGVMDLCEPGRSYGSGASENTVSVLLQAFLYFDRER